MPSWASVFINFAPLLYPVVCVCAELQEVGGPEALREALTSAGLTPAACEEVRRALRNPLSALLPVLPLARSPGVKSPGVSTDTPYPCPCLAQVSTFLSVLPTVHVRAEFVMEGEEEIVEQDVAKCKVWGCLLGAGGSCAS